MSEKNKKIERIYNLIILDESGSMSGLEKMSVDGVNETIQTIRGAANEHPEPLEFKEAAASDSEKFAEWNNFINANQKDMSDSLAVSLTYPIGETHTASALPDYIINGINNCNNLLLRAYGGANMEIYLSPESEKKPFIRLTYDKSAVYKALESYKTYDEAVSILESIGEAIPSMPYTITNVDYSTENGAISINSVSVKVNAVQEVYTPQIITAVYNSETGVLEKVKVTESDKLKKASEGKSATVPIEDFSKMYTDVADEYYIKIFIMDLNDSLMPLANYTYAD